MRLTALPDNTAYANMAIDAFRKYLQHVERRGPSHEVIQKLLMRKELEARREWILARLRERGLLDAAVAKLRAGSATRSDSLRSIVGVGNAQLQLLTAQAQLASAEANLGRLIGVTERVEAVDDSGSGDATDATEFAFAMVQ